MINNIVQALNKNNIKTYIINEVNTESVELFFIKKELDMNRAKKVASYSVTVFNDFEKENTKFRGASTVTIHPSMNEEEINETLKDAYYSAGFVFNKYYELPKGEKSEKVVIDSKIEALGLEKSAESFTEAMFKYDNYDKGLVNSGEIFLEKVNKRILTSEGVDASYEKSCAKGEFVAQWVENEDVETYVSFKYDDLETEEFSKKVKDAIEITREREKANTLPKAGEYRVIIEGNPVEEIFYYYKRKSDVSMIYQKASSYKVGDKLQGEDVKGDKLNIELVASVPYSNEGVKLSNRPLVEEGTLKTTHGLAKFAYYLGETLVGDYSFIKIKEGSKELSKMKEGDYIHIVNFSGFQVDPITGNFAGEIRLAFVKEGDNITPVTGGSISGNLEKVHGDMYLSKETQKQEHFEGPLAVEIKNVSVAGR